MHQHLIGLEMPLDAYEFFEVRHVAFDPDSGDTVMAAPQALTDPDPRWRYEWTVYGVSNGLREAAASFANEAPARALAAALYEATR
jgi:hypothetical protein